MGGLLNEDAEWSPPREKKKSKRDEDGDEDEGSEMPSLEPRNLSYSPSRAKVYKSAQEETHGCKVHPRREALLFWRGQPR